MGSRHGRAIPKALKKVLVAPLLTLALKDSAKRYSKVSIRYLLCPQIAHELMLSVKNDKRRK